MRAQLILVTLAVSFLLGGCANEFLADDDAQCNGGKCDAIDDWNDPSRFWTDLERHFDRLPRSGEAKNIPWSGDYWASRRDSINVRWNGELSPSEKYAAAFGQPGFPDRVSEHVGVDSSREEIPGWVGICEGWAAAAIQEMPPEHSVTRNGITFHAGDIEGLITYLYARGNSPSKFLSRRCNDDNARFDDDGRAVSARCRDTNPGTLHLIATNALGIKKRSFVEDRTYDAEVWNQPVRGYRITRQNEISKQEAHAILGVDDVPPATDEILANESVALDGELEGSVRMPASGLLHLNLTILAGNAELYAKEGSAPATDDWTCRSMTGNVIESCTVRTDPGTEVFWMVKGVADASTVSLTMAYPVNAPYAFNPAAERFVEVKMTLDYITESSPGASNNYIDAHTLNDRYHYILEATADGIIIGGEYVGGSRQNHPDFLWLPTGEPYGSSSGIRYEDVKSLLDESRGEPSDTARTEGEDCWFNYKCGEGLVCRPLGLALFSSQLCMPLGYETGSDYSDFSGDGYCGHFCDSDADCADGHHCDEGFFENGMCLAKGHKATSSPPCD